VFSGAWALPRCRKYEARLEDYLDGTPDSETQKHLSQCAHCRAALEDSRLAGGLLREVWESNGEMRSVFVQRVRGVMRSDLSSKTWQLLSVFGRRGYEK
jgi:hypothetical protein